MLYIPTKNTALPEISSKGAGIAFLVKIKNKMLLQTKGYCKCTVF